MQKPKGTKDVYGKESKLRSFVFRTLEEISDSFNFEKIDTPIFETEEVFIKASGKTSDIVTKQMYHFKDKSNRNLVLRPEGTAGIVRAVVENKLYANSLPLKFYYYGQMFRYENPQKGRQRQFTQFGIEVFGPKSPYLDVEIITMAAIILDSLKIKYDLRINSLGTKEARIKWNNELRKYFEKHKSKLEETSKLRLKNNPSRILDDKIESKKDFVKKAPNISAFYSKEDKEYFEKITIFLKKFDINFKIDYKLVRGLDYYTETAFEFISKSKNVGSKNTIIGGGRYNDLVKRFDGPNLSGIGFAIGIERLIFELKDLDEDLAINPDVYVLNIDKSSTATALGIVYFLRKNGLKVAWNYNPVKITKALAKADKAKALIKIIAGPKELSRGHVVIKTKLNQKKVKIENMIKYIEKIYGGNDE